MTSNYANSFSVTYRINEFYIELKAVGPKGEEIVSSIFMRPIDAKGLMKALQSMVTEYEEKVEEIEEPKIERGKEESEGYKGVAYG